MLHPTPYLTLVLSALTLVACGGGGGGGDSAVVAAPAAPTTVPATLAVPAMSPVSPELAKYEGVWRQDCVDHMRLTTTLVAISTNVFTVTRQELLFANVDCTGAVVATGGFGKPQETVQYRATQPNASVKLLSGDVITADVDPATSTLSVASFLFTGSGVTATYYIGTKTLTHVVYADGFANLLRDALDGRTTEGGLLLLNGELLALVPVLGAPTSFVVNQRYTR